MRIAIDFDGTCAKWGKYPEIGEEVPHCIAVLKKLIAKGHNLYVWTVRNTEDYEMIKSWFESRSVHIASINWLFGQTEYSDSPKVDADIYIDDKALGCPLKHDYKRNDEAFDVRVNTYVNWFSIEKLLIERNIL